ncbi:hypothetical protein L3X38_012100 [Prunus dulcis]|uniref:Acyl-CoA oxidase C-alpha1 domain-containing protein n=1 Tax=Prunus dulcis TaxID=3755 RepID=A0AAD4WIN5_PRUDU|nr:hypothetical protein L3X38_012100 [Prunus dulcis]
MDGNGSMSFDFLKKKHPGLGIMLINQHIRIFTGECLCLLLKDLTELGHGSDVQGLETTATFDPKTDEFVLNSPTLTSSKWWPGGLGKAATHTVAFARLITDGKDHGVNGFIVQLRNLDDHLPLPGITVGDIGMKFGNGAYNSMDNGVLRFDNVIDYKTQQSRLFPLLASAYAFRFVGEWLKWLYTDVTQKLQANDFSTLPEAHACTAGLKSLTTSATADAIEECRKLFGGHGYLSNSGHENALIGFGNLTTKKGFWLKRNRIWALFC